MTTCMGIVQQLTQKLSFRNIFLANSTDVLVLFDVLYKEFAVGSRFKNPLKMELIAVFCE